LICQRSATDAKRMWHRNMPHTSYWANRSRAAAERRSSGELRRSAAATL